MSDADGSTSPEVLPSQDVDFLWSWIAKLAKAASYDDVPDRYPGKRVTDLMLPELEEAVSELRSLALGEYETVYLLTKLKEMETQLDMVDLTLGERTTRHTVDRRKMTRRTELLYEQTRTLTNELARARAQATRAGNDLDHLRQSVRATATAELEKLYPAERFEPPSPPGPDGQAAPRQPSGWRGLLGAGS